MEIVILLLLIVLTGLVGGAVYYLPREMRKGSRFLPRSSEASATVIPELSSKYAAEIERFRAEARQVIGEVEAELSRLRETLRSSAEEQESRLVQLRTQVADLDGKAADTLEQALRDLRAQHETELRQLREMVTAAIAAMASSFASSEAARQAERRIDALNELYRLLAKLESTVISVANPVLLPGEPLTLPPDLPAEALRWDTWKDVGNAAFAFADAFALRRIDLDDATCRELSLFVSDLRQLLTTSIYPYLQSAATNPDARKSLRRSLEQLAAEFPRARECLERAYREQA